MPRLVLAALLALLVAAAVAQSPFCTADIGVEPYETLVDKITGPYSLQVAQLEPDKQVVLMLASGVLYKSVNGGKTFDKVDVTSSVYFSQIVRTADERIVYLPSSTDIWVSLDKGNSFVQRPYDHSKFTIWADYCEPHPTKGEWLACLSLNPEFPTKSKSRWQAVVTQDMAATWTVVANYALDLGWAYDPDHPTRIAVDALFISKVDSPSNDRDQFSYTRPDYTLGEYVISTKKWSPKVQGVPVFFQSEGDYVAPSYAVVKGEIVLKQVFHSEDHGQQWHSYSFPINFYVWSMYQQFPQDGTNTGYPFFITDSAVFFFTWDQQYIFSMYVSDDEDHAYSKAIERIKGFDFAPFEGIEGVYVANNYADKNAMKNGVAKTSITYDNGGNWYPLRIPDGKSCPPDEPNCQLNLFGSSDSMFGRFYSWYDAVGVMVGTGTLTEEIDPEGDVNTYLSADGGLNWIQIRDGPTTYEFADHGGLMLFADAGKPTTDIMYSWNGGNTFSECAITDKAFNMYNIITGNASSTEFWVYGERTVRNVTRGVVILVDFSQFHERTCEASDYETFTPSTPDNTSCILGQRTSYTRRKLGADCFNPAGFESQTVTTVCPCHEDDYECGYCYEYSATTNQCVWTCDADEQGQAPEDCEDVWYPKSNGWRLVPGTKCNLNDPKSLKRLGTPELCPSGGPSSTTTMVVLTVLFVIILITILAAVGFIAYSQNDAVKRWVNEKLNQAPADTFSLPESALADKGPADE